MKDVDTAKLLEYARQAKATGRCRSVPLACMVETICKKALCYKGETGKDFFGYSEDLKLDMYGNAVYVVYRAILENAEFDDGDKLFNYLYTTALNSIRKTLNRYYLKLDRECSIVQEMTDGSFQKETDHDLGHKKNCLNFKTRVKGLFPMYEKKVFEVAARRKLVRLQKVIRLAVDEFVENMNKKDIKQLINRARKIREGAAC